MKSVFIISFIVALYLEGCLSAYWNKNVQGRPPPPMPRVGRERPRPLRHHRHIQPHMRPPPPRLHSRPHHPPPHRRISRPPVSPFFIPQQHMQEGPPPRHHPPPQQFPQHHNHNNPPPPQPPTQQVFAQEEILSEPSKHYATIAHPNQISPPHPQKFLTDVESPSHGYLSSTYKGWKPIVKPYQNSYSTLPGQHGHANANNPNELQASPSSNHQTSPGGKIVRNQLVMQHQQAPPKHHHPMHFNHHQQTSPNWNLDTLFRENTDHMRGPKPAYSENQGVRVPAPSQSSSGQGQPLQPIKPKEHPLWNKRVVKPSGQQGQQGESPGPVVVKKPFLKPKLSHPPPENSGHSDAKSEEASSDPPRFPNKLKVRRPIRPDQEPSVLPPFPHKFHEKSQSQPQSSGDEDDSSKPSKTLSRPGRVRVRRPKPQTDSPPPQESSASPVKQFSRFRPQPPSPSSGESQEGERNSGESSSPQSQSQNPGPVFQRQRINFRRPPPLQQQQQQQQQQEGPSPDNHQNHQNHQNHNHQQPPQFHNENPFSPNNGQPFEQRPFPPPPQETVESGESPSAEQQGNPPPPPPHIRKKKPSRPEKRPPPPPPRDRQPQQQQQQQQYRGPESPPPQDRQQPQQGQPQPQSPSYSEEPYYPPGFHADPKHPSEHPQQPVSFVTMPGGSPQVIHHIYPHHQYHSSQDTTQRYPIQPPEQDGNYAPHPPQQFHRRPVHHHPHPPPPPPRFQSSRPQIHFPQEHSSYPVAHGSNHAPFTYGERPSPPPPPPQHRPSSIPPQMRMSPPTPRSTTPSSYHPHFNHHSSPPPFPPQEMGDGFQGRSSPTAFPSTPSYGHGPPPMEFDKIPMQFMDHLKPILREDGPPPRESSASESNEIRNMHQSSDIHPPDSFFYDFFHPLEGQGGNSLPSQEEGYAAEQSSLTPHFAEFSSTNKPSPTTFPTTSTTSSSSSSTSTSARAGSRRRGGNNEVAERGSEPLWSKPKDGSVDSNAISSEDPLTTTSTRASTDILREIKATTYKPVYNRFPPKREEDEGEEEESNTPRPVLSSSTSSSTSSSSSTTTDLPEEPSTFKSRRHFRRRRPETAVTRRRFFSSRVKEETTTSTAEPEKETGLRTRRLIPRRRLLSPTQETSSTTPSQPPPTTQDGSVTYGESQWFRVRPTTDSIELEGGKPEFIGLGESETEAPAKRKGAVFSSKHSVSFS